MKDAFHIRLAQLIARTYAPLFSTDPKAVEVADLGFELLETVFGRDFGGDVVPYGVVVWDGQTDCAIVALCGTRTEVEWASDAAALLIPCTWGGGAIHRGFSPIFDSLETSQQVPIQAFIAPYRTIVTGHSLGAALATLLAAAAKAATLVTFASPRCGDMTFAAWMTFRVPAMVRYAVSGDIVPDLPPVFPLPFRHVCPSTDLAATGPVPGGLDSLAYFHAITTYIAAIQSV